MREGATDDEQVEYLVAVPGQIERPRPPPLRDSADVEHGAHEVRGRHGPLVRQRHVPPRIAPVHHRRMHGGHNAEHCHGHEQRRPVGAELALGELGGEEGGDSEKAEGGDGGEVEDLVERVALEDVVDWGEEGGDDHDGDAGVVEAGEEEVEAAGVAAKEVAEA